MLSHKTFFDCLTQYKYYLPSVLFKKFHFLCNILYILYSVIQTLSFLST